MFREMRRFKQQLSQQELDDILTNSTSGVLSLIGDDGYPYGVPMSFAYSNNSLIFHGAITGHKADAIRKNPKASFCIIDRDAVIADEYTTNYRSVIAFGKIREITAPQEKLEYSMVLAGKYRPGFDDISGDKIKAAMERMAVYVMEIEHVTGKKKI